MKEKDVKDVKEVKEKEVETKKEGGTEKKGESSVEKKTGMFDKLDDIIYEPIHLMCEALNQPLKGMQANRDLKVTKKQAELAAELAERAEIFKQDLEIRQQKLKMEQSDEERKLDEEFRMMIADNNRQIEEDYNELNVKLREEMAAAAKRTVEALINIEVESRKKIITLYDSKKKDYLELQTSYRKELMETMKDLNELFPDGSGKEMMLDEIKSQTAEFKIRATNFHNLLDEDMRNVLGVIDAQTKELSSITNQYFMPNQQTPVLNGTTTQNQNILEANNVVQVIDEQ